MYSAGISNVDQETDKATDSLLQILSSAYEIISNGYLTDTHYCQIITLFFTKLFQWRLVDCGYQGTQFQAIVYSTVYESTPLTQLVRNIRACQYAEGWWMEHQC